MKLITVGIGIVVIAVLIIASIFPTSLFGIIDYRTGLTLDTSAEFYEHKKNYVPLKDSVWMKGAGNEVIPKDKYIVSWQPDEYGQLITARTDFQYHARATCEGWLCACGYNAGVALGRYWTTVNYINCNGESTEIIDTKNDWFDPDYVYWVRGADSSRYSDGNGHYLPNAQYKLCDWLQDTKWHVPWKEDSPEDACWYTMSTDTIEFKMKGSLIGALELSTVIEYSERENSGILCGWDFHLGEALVCNDEVYLISGEGEINIESTNAIRQEGSDTTPETDIVYTKYVYEEDSTVTISVDAMYSGAALDPGDPGYTSGKGWSLRIYDSSGTLRDSYGIDDDVRGYKIYYSIPSGAFIPNDPNDNEWRVVLMNTLWDQSETRLFVVDSFEKMPGKTTVSTDKNRYVQFDTVYVTVEAEANPDVGGIDHFKIWATYGSPTSTDYALTVKNYAAFLVSGSNYKYTATTEFQLSKGDKYVYIRAHAIDGDGRAGPEGETTIFSEQQVGNYKVTVNVKSAGVSVKDAKVVLSDRTTYTGSTGVADVYVQHGTYDLMVSKKGYETYTEDSILVNKDMSIDVNLKKGGEISSYLAIIVAIVIFALFCILAIFLPMPGGIYGKVLLVVLGALIAVIMFYVLGGIL